MKLDWRDWRVVWGAVVVSVLIVIGSYFGGHWIYRLDDELLAPPPTITNLPATPIDLPPTVLGTDAESEPDVVTSDEEVGSGATREAAASSSKKTDAQQMSRKTLAQLRIKKKELEAEINQLNDRRSELNNQSVIDYELVTTETPRDRKLQEEIDRLEKILETKLGPNPTLEECQATEEWRQLAELLSQQTDMIKNLESLGDFYYLNKQEIDKKMYKLLDERLAVMHRIKDLELQLASE